MKHKNIVTLILSLTFFAAYMWFCTGALGNMDQLLEAFEQNFETLAGNLALLSFIGGAVLLEPLPLLAVVGGSLAVGGGAWCLISANYIRVVTMSRTTAKNGYRERRLRVGSLYSALTGKEFARFTASPTYMMNGGIGLLLGPALAVFVLIRRASLLQILSELALPGAAVGAAAVAVPVIVVLSMMTISASSVSMEGKNFWILRTLPADVRTVLYAKMTPHVLLGTVSLLLTSVLLAVALRLSALWVCLAVLLPVLLNVGAAAFGLFLNIMMPKLSWQNEAEPVKQSMPVFIVMFSWMLIGTLIGVAGIAASLLLPAFAAPLVVVSASLLFTALPLVLLFTIGARHYAALEI